MLRITDGKPDSLHIVVNDQLIRGTIYNLEQPNIEAAENAAKQLLHKEYGTHRRYVHVWPMSRLDEKGRVDHYDVSFTVYHALENGG